MCGLIFYFIELTNKKSFGEKNDDFIAFCILYDKKLYCHVLNIFLELNKIY